MAGHWWSSRSHYESTLGQAQPEISQQALKNWVPVISSQISQIKLLVFKKQKFVDKLVWGLAAED